MFWVFLCCRYFSSTNGHAWWNPHSRNVKYFTRHNSSWRHAQACEAGQLLIGFQMCILILVCNSLITPTHTSSEAKKWSLHERSYIRILPWPPRPSIVEDFLSLNDPLRKCSTPTNYMVLQMGPIHTVTGTKLYLADEPITRAKPVLGCFCSDLGRAWLGSTSLTVLVGAGSRMICILLGPNWGDMVCKIMMDCDTAPSNYQWLRLSQAFHPSIFSIL